ncbi:MAG: hypothetical protein EKK39_02030 [Sphingobacteriales bacterium]|nr:MAG: hypothetical protein EKK39_02030 [Sphingobacteriales bacterium]
MLIIFWLFKIGNPYLPIFIICSNFFHDNLILVCSNMSHLSSYILFLLFRDNL